MCLARGRQAIGQICSSNSMASNLAQCVKLVGQAASAGAKVKSSPFFRPSTFTITDLFSHQDSVYGLSCMFLNGTLRKGQRR